MFRALPFAVLLVLLVAVSVPALAADPDARDVENELRRALSRFQYGEMWAVG